jgi:1-acyl-sn-glycerol-3-phosphate acyltransferase
MNRSPRAIRWILKLFPAIRFFYRVEFHGLEKIPDRPIVLIANHSIGAIPEIIALLYAWEYSKGILTKKANAPAIYGLAHRFGFKIPLFSSLLRKLGGIPATHEEANRVLDSGHSLAIFPGGNTEVVRHYRDRNTSDFKHRRGWIQIAKKSKTDILTVTISGSHGTNPVLYSSHWLAKVLLINFFFGLKKFPITLGQFVWISLFLFLGMGVLPFWVLSFGGVFLFIVTPLFPLFPTKITIHFEEVVSSQLSEDEIYSQVQGAINQRLTSKA